MRSCLITLRLVTFADFFPYSLDYFPDVIMTGDQMKRVVILNKIRISLGLNVVENIRDNFTYYNFYYAEIPNPKQ